MVQLTINGIKVNAEEGMTILDAAKSVGISIPTLCHLKNLDPTGACRICAVEVEGFRGLTPSCAYPVSEGLVVETDSPRVRKASDGAGKFSCPDPQGACYDVFGPPFAGSVGLCAAPPGAGCYGAQECNDPQSEICSVDTETCESSECTPTDPPTAAGCTGTSPLCIEQENDSGIGACYEECNPFDEACANGLECRNNTYGQTWGLCLNEGYALLGEACDPMLPTNWGTNTGCAAGGICLENECWQECAFFGAPTCNGATVCHLFGYCPAWVGCRPHPGWLDRRRGVFSSGGRINFG